MTMTHMDFRAALAPVFRLPVPALPVLALVLAVALLPGCGRDGEHGSMAADSAQRIEIWAHAGREEERRTLEAQIDRFRAERPEVRVDLTWIPEGSYNGQVQAAALAGRLPDLLEFDGPYLYSYAWQGHLRPLDDLLPAGLREDLLPSIAAQGTYRGRLYGIGTFDSGLGLWGNRTRLRAVGARIPDDPGDAWSGDEFDALLERLARDDPDGQVLDLKLNYTGEWFSYAFSPLLQSAGGDLVDRAPGGLASGTLDGPESVAAMAAVQSWIRRGRVDPNLDDAAFTRSRVALAWGGHWNFPGYHAALGDDLLLLPLPRLGEATVTGQGSWQWGITRRARDPELALAFIAFLLRPEEVLAMSEANGGVPATRSAVRKSELYGPGGPLRLFARQLEEGYARPRPRTPAYPVISDAFARAFQDIRHGAEPVQALGWAARRIDRELRDNRHYPEVAGTAR
ncbi:extracellular solute-binding protein, family 1 [Thioalkalivibrio nitratireducens DSM 14787]|uniref:Extracellular solute-binding protein, family 1 n=2 Tax=Thioalkalivibrio nitratireducens TaxID=186931 RepID=L0DTF3_THIND|nr:extracellular solute-binding protein, family 1 [Thioalkalivibrio nitratireducens DSM 14787]